MEGHFILLLFATLCLSTGITSREVINLGFLTPYPVDDSAVSPRLAKEWLSAIQIAHEILEKKNPDKFVVQPILKNSNCTKDDASTATRTLVELGVVGIVGPACSEAAIGAAQYLAAINSSIPLISFAATAPELSNREIYPNFFRTAYSDVEQVRAIMNVTQLMNWTKIYMLYSEDSYGAGLHFQLSQKVVEFNANRPNGSSILDLVSIGVPLDLPSTGYSTYLSSIQPSLRVPVLLATTPQTAENLFMEAYSKSKLNYPWWFFGTDGVTAFDLVGKGPNFRNFAFSLQEHIGLMPYRGDVSAGSIYSEYLNTWKSRNYTFYPGLLTFPRYPHFDKTRSYVPFLIDAVTAYYEVFADLEKQGKKINAEHVMASLQDGGFSFSGCTGKVAFKSNGDRDETKEPASYDFVTMKSSTWQTLGTWNDAVGEPLKLFVDKIFRPGRPDGTAGPRQYLQIQNGTNITIIASPTGATESDLSSDMENPPTAAPADTFTDQEKGGGKGQGSAGKIAAIVVPLGIVTAVLAVLYVMYLRRQQQKTSEFVRLVF